MKYRCYNPKSLMFKHYGGRGISICEQWLGPVGFVRFVADMGMCPSPRHSIDRIDNNGNYSPENCRWETSAQQARNRRNNVFVTHGGETMCVGDWASRTGLDYCTLDYRLKAGWPVEKALATPGRAKQA